MSRLVLGRAAIVLGIAVSLISLGQTVGHVFDDSYVFPQLTLGPLHAKFHFLREALGDVGHVTVMLLVAFLPERYRSRPAWLVLAVTVAAYYGAFWLGYPILGVGAPNAAARTVHAAITLCGITGVMLLRPLYRA